VASTLHSSPTACRRICTRGGDEDAGHQCRTANPSAKPMPKSVSFQNPLPPQGYLLFVQTKTIKAPQTIAAALAMPAPRRVPSVFVGAAPNADDGHNDVGKRKEMETDGDSVGQASEDRSDGGRQIGTIFLEQRQRL
jgi:hypothetical protein